MSMSKKDFEMFAVEFGKTARRFQNNQGTDDLGYLIAQAFCDVCERINPRFDREKWWKRSLEVFKGEEE